MMMQKAKEGSHYSGELNISFGYQCNFYQNSPTKVNCELGLPNENQIQDSNFKFKSSSFSCLSGAALSANATLANTNMCNGLIAEEILPGLDSPKSFRRMTSSPSLSSMDLLCSSQSSLSTLGGSMSTDNDLLENNTSLWKSMSAPTRIDSSSFLNAMDVQMAGGAAGEDRVQAVCSEENGWLFCGVYDGFNGRDAADFLAGTLYENIGFYLHLLEWHNKKQGESGDMSKSDLSLAIGALEIENKSPILSTSSDGEFSNKSFRVGVLDCLVRALAQAESDFMYTVEQSMDDRPDLVSVGSCVLTVLLHVKDLYVLNLGDSRAVLAACDSDNGPLKAIQLTEIHTVDNELEYKKLMDDHPDDPSPVIGGRVKGKLKLTRAFGVGYLKEVITTMTRCCFLILGSGRLMDITDLIFDSFNLHLYVICREN